MLLAFRLSMPIFLTYFPLAVVFGVLFSDLHTYWFMAPLMTLVVYGGSAQLVALGLIEHHASYGLILASTVFLAARNCFYGLGLYDRYQMPFWKKWIAVFLLVDVTYMLMMNTEPFEHKKHDHSFCLWLGVLTYVYRVVGTAVGALFSNQLQHMHHLQFMLVAFFSIMLLEQYRQHKNLAPILIGLGSILLALCLVSGCHLILLAVSLSCVVLFIYARTRRGVS